MSSCGAATQQCLLFSRFPLSTHDAEPSPGLGTGKAGMRVPAPWTLGGGGGSFVGRLPTSRVGHQGVVVKDELRERWEESYWQDGLFLRNLEGMQGRIRWAPPPPLPKCPGRTLQGCVLARGGAGLGSEAAVRGQGSVLDGTLSLQFHLLTPEHLAPLVRNSTITVSCFRVKYFSPFSTMVIEPIRSIEHVGDRIIITNRITIEHSSRKASTR